MRLKELLAFCESAKPTDENFEKALTILFDIVEREVKKSLSSIPSLWRDFADDAAWLATRQLEQHLGVSNLPNIGAIERRLTRSGSTMEKMFKTKYGVSSEKWIDASIESEKYDLTKTEIDFFDKLSRELTSEITPKDVVGGNVKMYKFSPKILYVEAYGASEYLGGAFFKSVGMTMGEVIDLLTKHGAKLGTRPKRVVSSQSTYD